MATGKKVAAIVSVGRPVVALEGGTPSTTHVGTVSIGASKAAAARTRQRL